MLLEFIDLSRGLKDMGQAAPLDINVVIPHRIVGETNPVGAAATQAVPLRGLVDVAHEFHPEATMRLRDEYGQEDEYVVRYYDGVKKESDLMNRFDIEWGMQHALPRDNGDGFGLPYRLKVKATGLEQMMGFLAEQDANEVDLATIKAALASEIERLDAELAKLNNDLSDYLGEEYES